MIEGEVTDFRLAFLKYLINEFPELVSDKLKRETAYKGRSVMPYLAGNVLRKKKGGICP